MLAEFRQVAHEVAEGLTSPASGHPVGVHPEIPGDLAELPCIVVGLPTASPSNDGTHVTSLDVFVLAHPAETPGRDTALIALTDAVFDAYGGTAGIKVDGAPLAVPWHLVAQELTTQRVRVGEVEYPAYLITIESAYRTC